MKRLNSFLDWSIGVGRMFGIPIKLHISIVFFLLPVLQQTWLGPWLSLEYVVGIVASILLHELGHALTAKRYRLRGLSITLHGFGGFASSEGYRSPTQALVITLAGPAVTFAIGILCWSIGSLALRGQEVDGPLALQLYLLQTLGWLNILLGFLNLLPSLPFDGGHAVRALLSRKRSEFSAMRGAAHIGLIAAPILLIFGLVTTQRMCTIFGLIGLATSLVTLLQTGGVRFGELFAERRARKEKEAHERRKQEKHDTFLDAVHERERKRKEEERLRKLFRGD